MQWIYLLKVLWQKRYFRRWWWLFFVVLALYHKYSAQISIQLSTRVHNFAKKLSTFIESLLISTHWMKIFQFFFSVFEIEQAQLKNSNYDILLSAWLVSMEIYPKGNFFSIWHLPIQIKVHKENIITKRETSVSYLEPCQTFKMKLFAKVRKGFQPLTIVFIVETILCRSVFRTQSII